MYGICVYGVLLWDRVECAGCSYSMWGKGLSAQFWIECAGMLSGYLGIACSV